MRRLAHIAFLAAMLVVVSGQLAAQRNVWFEGETANAAGKHIALYGYADMLTMQEVLLDSTTIDTLGFFSLATYANYPRLVFLQIEDYSQSFYIEPSRHYKLYLSEFDWSIDERQNVHLDPVALPFEFLDLPADELNLRIGAMEHLVDSMVSANRLRLDARFRPDRRYFDTLEREVRQKVVADEGSFMQRYRDFTLAQMRMDMRFDSRSRLFAKHVADADILYHDENFMRLFFGIFAHSISKGTKRVPLWRMVDWMDEGNLKAYLDSVGLDPMLRNEQVRELAVVQALKEAFYNPVYSRSAVREMASLLAKQSKFDEHRQLVEHLLREFDSKQGGAEVPEFLLPDADRQYVSLDSFKGKWVYLSFVRVGDPNSLSEIETMAHFYDTICGSGEVEFVSVSCDREFQKMYHFLRMGRKSARYHWPWFHFDANYQLLQEFGVVSYPTFVLINPEGKVVNSYAPPPATGFLLRGPWSIDPFRPTLQDE